MEQKGHVASLLALVAVAITALACLVLVAKPSGEQEGLKGYTQFTVNPSNQSYTDSADMYQNVQAMAERMASGSQYAVLQADSTGKMQRVAPTALAGDWTLSTLTLSGALTASSATFSAEVNYRAATEALTASNTIAVAESNKFFFLSGATSTQTLPTSTPAGQKYTFYVSGALSGDVTVVTNGAENVINGTIIVAGAVVDCDAEDTLTFVSDGENVGDFFSLISTGSGWLLGESGVLTGAKLTCSAT